MVSAATIFSWTLTCRWTAREENRTLSGSHLSENWEKNVSKWGGFITFVQKAFVVTIIKEL